MEGRWCRLEPLDPARHTASLFAAYGLDTEGRGWTYFPYGPFPDEAGFRAWLDEIAAKDDPLFHAIVDESGDPVGVASFMRISPDTGSIEVGHIHYSPRLKRTRAATEAMYLMMRRAFDELGYRRYEWKCDSLNAPSRSAAERLGFTYEGTFRQHVVSKGRNRDTAWYSIIDSEWPAIRDAFEAWLDSENFDAAGKQRRRLEALRQASLSGSPSF
jgi:RimJ/RimL family protein N-acetyltransferase